MSDCFKIWHRGEVSKDTYVHTKICQLLDKHWKGIHDDTFWIPQFFEMQYSMRYEKFVHRGVVSIEEYLCRVNMAHNYGQIWEIIGKYGK